MTSTFLTKVNQMKRSTLTASMCLLLLMNAGCDKADTTTKTEIPTPMVTVSAPVSKLVSQYEYFTGRLESTEQVEIRARVTGYLVKVHFQPGVELKKGTRLFDIDPKPFEADVSQVQSQIARTQASLDRLTQEFGRTEKLRKTGAASQEDYDKALGSKLEAEATLKADKARLLGSELNLGYTKIDAPIDGKIGDILVTEGNLIMGGQGGATLLTSIVAVERMDMAFDVDEITLQRIQQSIRDGKLKLAKDGRVPVEMAIAIHGDQFPMKGEIYFINNQVDPKTGTIRMKAEFPNPKSAEGGRVLTSGMFGRVRLRLGDPVNSIIVPDVAIASDQGTKYIYAIGADNKAVRLNVTLGVMEEGMRVIESVQGPDDKQPRPLKSDERIIINGIQRVRPGMKVDPKAPAAPVRAGAPAETPAKSPAEAAPPKK